MKGETHEFLKLVWHFLNLEINAGMHVEGGEREKERERNRDRERNRNREREKLNKHVLRTYYVPDTFPGGQTPVTSDYSGEQAAHDFFIVDKYYRHYFCEYNNT